MTGYEYAPFNSTQGNTVLTAYLLTCLSRFTFLEANMSDPNSTFQQNLKWLTDKRDKKGLITLQANETEASGRAPHNASFPYVLINLQTINFY